MYVGTLPAVSNRADWIDCVELRDTEEASPDDLIDLTGCTIILALLDEDMVQRGTASTDDGNVNIVDTGVFEFTFPRSTMTTLVAGIHQLGCTIERDDETVQILIGSYNVVNGLVPV